jgi:hypothetical protein
MKTWLWKKKVSTIIVNNLTNINKTNNHLSSQIIECKEDRGTQMQSYANPGHGLGQVHKCVGVKLVKEIPTQTSWYLNI